MAGRGFQDRIFAPPPVPRNEKKECIMKILIVEDEPSLREIMVRTLTREQYVVEQAADYAAALDKIAAYDYDCILLDIMLPGGSGLRLLEELKRRRSPAAVMGAGLISGRDRPVTSSVMPRVKRSFG